MTDSWLLHWAVLAVSLFNFILLTWLGLAVLLNAERKTWGLWLAAGEILLGSAFFLVHSIILGYGFNTFERSLNFWWRAGWVPVVTIPYIWYVVILWYSGFWDRFGEKLNRRHYPWFVATTLLAVGSAVLLIFANPLPSFLQIVQLNFSTTPSLGGIPLLILVYPVYILLCIALSLDVLRHPAPSGRIMGDLARRRARPWLTAAATTQIIVSLLVGWVMFWVINRTHRGYDPAMNTAIAQFDLVIATLIAIAVILLGQAITSYEVFTGQALPRRGLARYWRRAIILAGGFSALVSLSLSLDLHPIFSILLSALLMTAFFALLSWRSFAERQIYIDQLRPFVSSQRVYDQLLATAPSEVDLEAPFHALCQDVLGARQAYLTAWGSLAPLAGEALVFFQEQKKPQAPDLGGLLGPWISPETLWIPLPSETPGDWRWLIPLWSERGLSGALLLGRKQDGGLYTLEEIEIARTVGERLIDTRASAEIARRLIALQRQRLAESQVADRRTRRVLHDEVLPNLHAALIALSASPAANQPSIEALSEAHRQISDLLRNLPVITPPEMARHGLVGALQKTVENEFFEAFAGIVWQIPETHKAQLEQLSPLAAEVVYFAAREAIRNAARHGRVGDQLPKLTITTEQAAPGWEIRIKNEGASQPPDPPDPQGSGQGLALHGTLMAVIGGELSFEQVPGKFWQVALRFPAEVI